MRLALTLMTPRGNLRSTAQRAAKARFILQFSSELAEMKLYPARPATR
jgi:hypothetical protein